MKPNPKTAAQKAALKRAGALDSFISTSAGPFDAASLSRSYGVDFPEVVRILKSRGKHHG
jgi:hypothetical protein